MFKNVFKDLRTTEWCLLCKMTTRNFAEMSAEIKILVTKNDINSMKSFIKQQSGLTKNLTAKILTIRVQTKC